MYKSGYVVAILQNNQTIKEKGGKVLLPFGSEYEIRLRNKTRKRAVVDAYIDGEIAAKGIVVNANDSIDLERYVKNTGHALLKWYPEKEPKPWAPPPAPQIIQIHDNICPGHHHHHCDCPFCRPRPFFGDQWHTGGYRNDCISGGGGTQSKGSSNANLTIGSNSVDLSADNVVFTNGVSEHLGVTVGDAGATIEGSVSHQSFSTINIDVDRENPTILTLHLVGVHIPEPVEPENRLIRECDDKPRPSKSKGKLAAYCSTCGRKRRTDEKFCPADGMRLDATSVS